MRVTDLSIATKTICKIHYKTNCGRCPLRQVCMTTPRLTEENHIKWIHDLNHLAVSRRITLKEGEGARGKELVSVSYYR